MVEKAHFLKNFKAIVIAKKVLSKYENLLSQFFVFRVKKSISNKRHMNIKCILFFISNGIKPAIQTKKDRNKRREGGGKRMKLEKLEK